MCWVKILIHVRNIFIQVTEETELEMPFLEAIPSGEDVWDESWSLSGSTVSINGTLKPFINNTDDLQSQNPSQQVSFSSKMKYCTFLAIKCADFSTFAYRS